MDRRSFLTQSAAVLGGLVAGPAQAANNAVCAHDKKLNAQICAASVRRPIPHLAAHNASVTSCWLACLQMVIKYHGQTVTPQSLLDEAYHGSVPSKPWDDLSQLKQPLTNDKKHPVSLMTEKLSIRAADAVDFLLEDQPLIIGAFGHPVVLSGLRYSGDRLGQMKIIDAMVFDPTPGKGRRVVNSHDWIDVSFISRIVVRK